MQLHHHQAEFDALETRIILITYSGTFWVEGWRKSTQVPYPLLLDEKKRIYKEYGMTKSWRGILDPQVVWYYVRGLHLPLVKGNPFQLGGDFIVDEAGILRFAHRSAEPTDRPSVNKILNELRKIEPHTAQD